jgi:hypothetical protein
VELAFLRPWLLAVAHASKRYVERPLARRPVIDGVVVPVVARGKRAKKGERQDSDDEESQRQQPKKQKVSANKQQGECWLRLLGDAPPSRSVPKQASFGGSTCISFLNGSCGHRRSQKTGASSLRPQEADLVDLHLARCFGNTSRSGPRFPLHQCLTTRFPTVSNIPSSCFIRVQMASVKLSAHGHFLYPDRVVARARHDEPAVSLL